MKHAVTPSDPLAGSVFAGPVIADYGKWLCYLHHGMLAVGSARLPDGRVWTLCKECCSRLGRFVESNAYPGRHHFVPGEISAHNMGARCECEPVTSLGVIWHQRSQILEDRFAALLRRCEGKKP